MGIPNTHDTRCALESRLQYKFQCLFKDGMYDYISLTLGYLFTCLSVRNIT